MNKFVEYKDIIVRKVISFTFLFLLMSFLLPNLAFAGCFSGNTTWYNPGTWCDFGGNVTANPLSWIAPSVWNQSQNTNQNTTQTTPSNAYSYNPSSGISGLITLFGSWLKALFPLIVALAVVWFAWNIFKYVIASNEEDKGNAKQNMVWGIIAIFVMVSIWGLVAILQITFFGGRTVVNPNVTKGVLGPFETGQASQETVDGTWDYKI